MAYPEEVFDRMDAHYIRYRELHPDKKGFDCWTIMCLEVYLQGDAEGECRLIRESWEEHMKYKRIKHNKENKRFKKRKRK